MREFKQSLLWGLLLMAPAAWTQEANLQVLTVAEKEVIVVNDQGEQETKIVPVATVVPGDVVVYTITVKNTSDKAAENVTVTDPIPEQMVYVEESVFGSGMEITFSVDGGVKFAKREELTVKDAEGKDRPAQANDLTHIRWVMNEELPSGSENYARFRARLE